MVGLASNSLLSIFELPREAPLVVKDNLGFEDAYFVDISS